MNDQLGGRVDSVVSSDDQLNNLHPADADDRSARDSPDTDQSYSSSYSSPPVDRDHQLMSDEVSEGSSSSSNNSGGGKVVEDVEAAVIAHQIKSQPRWIQVLEQSTEDPTLDGDGPEKTLGCISRSNLLRRICRSIVRWPWLDLLMIWMIVGNCVFLAFAEDPLRSSSHESIWIYLGYAAFNALFCIEMFCWMIAIGFRGYIRDLHYARSLDLLLNLLSTISLLPGLYEIKIFRIIRVLSAIRVFRSVQGLRTLGQAILHSLPALIDVTVLLIFLFFIYGLIGLQTWSGEFRQRCFDPNQRIYLTSPDRLCSMNDDRGYQCPSGTYCSDGIRVANPFGRGSLSGNITINGTSIFLPSITAGPNYGFTNFDNMLTSLLALFGMSSLDSWVFVMYWAQDIDGFAVWVYFVSFILLCTFFATNLVVAVIIVKYQEFSSREDEQGAAAVEADTEESVLPRELRPFAKLVAPLGKLIQPLESAVSNVIENRLRLDAARQAAASVSESVWFKRFIAACVVINIAVLSLDHYRAPESIMRLLFVSELLFTCIYALEMIIKILSGGWRNYLRHPWNAFDFCVVLLSVIGVVVTYISPNSGLGYLGIIRIVRLFNLVEVWYSLQRVMRTVLELRSYVYLTLLIVFYTFVFALIGRQLFAGKYDSRPMKPRWHFDDIYWSFITCWQVLNGDSWTAAMFDGMTVYPLSSIFFVTLYFFGANVLVKLFTSVLVDKFSKIPAEPPESDESAAPEASHIAHDDAAVRKIVFKNSTVTVRTEKPSREPDGESLYFFELNHPIRKLCIAFATNPTVSWCMFLIVVVNCIILAVDRPSTSPNARLILQTVDAVCLSLYVLESVMHMIAFGLFFGPAAYLRPKKIWNWLDVCVIFLSIYAWSHPALGPVRALRSLRVLRGVSRFEGSKVATSALISTLPTAFNVGLVVFLFWMIFALVGVKLFQGKFHFCSDSTISTESQCNGVYFDQSLGRIISRQWKNPPYHFDNIGAALLSLFQVAGGVAGIDVMYAAVDSTFDGQAPKRDTHPEYAAFFVLFTVVGRHFTLNLLAGAIIDNFSRMKQKLKGSAFMSDGQKKWVRMQRIFMKLKPSKAPKRPEDDPIRTWAYDVVISNRFRQFMNVVIALNTVVLCLRYVGSPSALSQFVAIASWAFIFLYGFEAALKLVALGADQYFGSAGTMSWTIFEFIIVCVSFGVVFAGFSLEHPIVRVVRALPLVRLVRQIERLRIVFDTFLFSLPSIGNISLLLFVVYYVYAIVGVYTFGNIKLQSKAGLFEDANFSHFGMALLTLFRLSTMDTWPYLMFDTQVQPPYCSMQSGDCGSYWNWIYFVSFIVIQVYILLNLLLAILMDTYAEYSRVDAYRKWPHFQRFLQLWSIRDPAFTGRLKPHDIEEILLELGPPLGFHSKVSRLEILRIFRDLGVRLTHDRHEVYYEHLLRALSTRALSVDFMSVFIEDKLEPKLSKQTLGDWFAAETVQRFWRRNKQRIKAFSAEKASIMASLVARHDKHLLARVVALLEKQQILHDVHLLRVESFASEQLSHWDAMHRTLGSATTGRTFLAMDDIFASPPLASLFSSFCQEQGDPPANIQFIMDLQSLEQNRAIDPMMAYEHARSIFDAYIQTDELSIPESELSHARAHIEQRLKVTTHSLHKLFSRARHLVLAHLESLFLSKFLAWTPFVEYSHREALHSQFLKRANDILIGQLASAQVQAERDNDVVHDHSEPQSET